MKSQFQCPMNGDIRDDVQEAYNEYYTQRRRNKMIHWGFLILTFITGFAAGYAFLYQMAKVASQVMGAVEEGAKRATL